MITTTKPSGMAHPPRRFRWWITSGAVSIFLLTLGFSCSASKAIDRLTIFNRTPFDVEVKVTDSTRESWLLLRAAEHESTTVNEFVTDMGATWVFRFHYGGRDVGELTVQREELVGNDWRIEVPSAVADEMRRLGFEPQPDQ